MGKTGDWRVFEEKKFITNELNRIDVCSQSRNYVICVSMCINILDS